MTGMIDSAARPPSRRRPGAGLFLLPRGDLVDTVLLRARRHGNLARACREALRAEDEGRLLEHQVRRLAHRDPQFAARLAAARAAGRAT